MIKGLILSAIVGIANPTIYYENEINSEDIVYTCKIVESEEIKHGDIIYDIEEGNVGDVVTLYVVPDVLYTTEYVKVNDVVLVAEEDGKTYKFALTEGENIITASFIIDNEEIANLIGVVDQVKNQGIQSILTVDNLFKCIYFLLSALLSSGFFITLIKKQKIKTATVNQLTELFTNLIKEVNNEEVKKALEGIFGQTVEKLVNKMDGVDELVNKMVKCMLLMQENTPESRLAIINELTLNDDNKKLSEEIKNMISKEVEAQNKAIEERNSSIEEMKKANQTIGSTKNPTEEGEDIGTL